MLEIKRKNFWMWDLDLANLVGRSVHVVTSDGSARNGKITAVKLQRLVIKDAGRAKNVDIPLHIELNGDANDVIEFSRMDVCDLS